MNGSRLRTVYIAGRRTTVRLEDAFWAALYGIAERTSMTINEILMMLELTRTGSRSSAIRVFVLRSIQGEGGPSSAGPNPTA